MLLLIACTFAVAFGLGYLLANGPRPRPRAASKEDDRATPPPPPPTANPTTAQDEEEAAPAPAPRAAVAEEEEEGSLNSLALALPAPAHPREVPGEQVALASTPWFADGKFSCAYRAEWAVLGTSNTTSPNTSDTAAAVPSPGIPTIAVSVTLSRDKDENKFVIEEGKALLALEHPHILRCFGLVAKADQAGFISELPGLGTAAQYLHAHKRLDPVVSLEWARAVCDALLYVRSRGMAHGDVSTHNVWLFRSGARLVPKLTGFAGRSPHPNGAGAEPANPWSTPAPLRGSPRSSQLHLESYKWLAPELMHDAGRARESSDVYSFAVVLYHLFTKQEPYVGTRMSAMQLIYAVSCNKLRPAIPPNLAPRTRRLLDGAWHEDPDKRPTFAALKAALLALSPAAVFHDPTAPASLSSGAAGEADHDPATSTARPFKATDGHGLNELYVAAPGCGYTAQDDKKNEVEEEEEEEESLGEEAGGALLPTVSSASSNVERKAVPLARPATEHPASKKTVVEVGVEVVHEEEEEEDEGVCTSEYEETPRQIPGDELVLGKVIAGGAYGWVARCTWMPGNGASPVPAAAKTLIKATNRTREMLLREAGILASLSHPSIIECYGVSEEANGSPILVTELASHGSMAAHIREENPGYGAAEALAWARGLADGMAHLERAGILHLDLKTENVLLTQDGDGDGAPLVAKLCDFGVSRHCEGSTNCTDDGTIRYMSPEMLIPGEKISSKTDVYSFALVVYELACRQIPFHNKNLGAIVCGVAAGHRPAVPAGATPALCTFLAAGWHQQRDRRPSFAEVKETLAAFSPRDFEVAVDAAQGEAVVDVAVDVVA